MRRKRYIRIQVMIIVVILNNLQKHYADINKQFNKDCGKTGGGTGPPPPQGNALDNNDCNIFIS